MKLNTKMNETVLKNKIEELKSYAVLYEKGITSNVIENCSFIVEVGALTIGTDDMGNIITYPEYRHPNSIFSKSC
jgi:hypothetical protein